MKYLSQPLALAGVALATTVYDLDNNSVLAELEADGLEFAGPGPAYALSIATSSQASSFSWIPDRDNCQDILDITSGFTSQQPNGDSESGLDMVLFTLSAVGNGDCTFRMAYANVANREFSFDEYV